MRENNIATGFHRYFRRRLTVVAAVAVLGSGIAVPVAAACADHAPASFWGRALQSVNAVRDAHAAQVAARRAAAARARAARRQPTPRKKWVTPSRYERTTYPGSLYAQGCDAGRRHTNGVVVLAFGKPAYNGHTYGTILFSNRFASNRAISRATMAYAAGYAHCLPKGSDARITLARGTSNYDPSVPSTYKAGKRWSQSTMQFAKYLRRHPAVAKHVSAAAAIDAEPAWDRHFRRTYDFFRGFRSAKTGYLLYNFGSLDGGVGSIWSLRQAFYVAGGMKDARVLPEIYFKVQARQWARLARLALTTYHRPVQFAGVMTQHYSGCRGCGFTAREAHSQLGQALKKHPVTRRQVRMLASATNIGG